MPRSLPLAALALMGATASPAFADSTTVRHGDLDLSSVEGRAVLDRRIAVAARNVCRVDGSRELRAVMESQRCYRDAMASTQTQLAAVVGKRTRAAT